MDAMIDTRILRIVRVFDAPRARLFTAWTDADQFAQWMCPPGFRLDACAFDVRKGGAWRVRGHKPGGEAFAKSGVYVEVKPPELLVFTWATHVEDDHASPRGHETTVSVELRAIGNKTELTLAQGSFVDTSDADGHTTGWQVCLDKLTGFLGSRS
jgi:uncharacterized protein YndB with AHSA1/START domain